MSLLFPTPSTGVFTFLKPVEEVFHAEGYEIYLVGGCVRDFTLGHPIKDFDLATDAIPDVTKVLLEKAGAKVIDKLGGNYGTVHCIWQGQDVEVTTYRLDKDYPAGDRRPVVEFSKSLEDDLRRRDFTINAMAMPVSGGILPLQICKQGQWDLHGNAELKTPIEAVKSMSDDPLRILRAYRFAARFGLSIDADLRAAMRRFSINLKFISRERIQQEIIKIAGGPRPEWAFRAMMEDGVMTQVFPELTVQVGYDQENPHHHLPLWEHTLSVVGHTKAQGGGYLAVITALLHDVAKPHSFQRAYACGRCNGKIRVNYGPIPVDELMCPCNSLSDEWTFVKKQFLGHDTLGADMAREMLTRLKFSSRDVRAVSDMIAWHQRDFRESHKSKVVRRFANLVGELAPEFLAFLKGDRLGHTPGEYSTIDYLEVLEQGAKELDLQELSKPIVDAHFIMRATGLKPGPELGKMMATIKQMTLDEDLVSKLQVLHWLSDYGGGLTLDGIGMLEEFKHE